MAGLKLIAGLGNPGAKYLWHRHNVGFWFVDALAQASTVPWRAESRLHGELTQFEVAGRSMRLLKPTTYVNHSGRSLAAVLNYFRIAPEECLVVHDDMDLPAGTARLKLDGGHGGHNGLRDIIKALDTRRFHRLRLGIGHPVGRGDVLSWVLGRPSADDEGAILDAMSDARQVLPMAVEGRFEEAMHALHTRKA